MFFFLVVLAANAQSAQKAARMSHDFRIAGRRAIAAINLLVRLCSPAPGVPSCNFDDNVKFEDKAAKAIEEADAQHDSAVDKSAVELLRQFNAATLAALLEREFSAREGKKFHPSAYCKAGACEAMYATCKKEAEQAFESGILPAKLECKSQSPRDSK
jgi:hypothetical protein